MTRSSVGRLGAALAASILAIGCAGGPTATESVVRPTLLLTETKVERKGDVTITTLRNGLTLIHKESAANEIVGVHAIVRAGSTRETDEKSGAANLMAAVMPKGTRTRSSDEIAEAMAALGSSLSVGAGYDTCAASMQCVAADLPEALEIFAESVLSQ
jgi:predicted Zn-dependent peptidase